MAALFLLLLVAHLHLSVLTTDRNYDFLCGHGFKTCDINKCIGNISVLNDNRLLKTFRLTDATRPDDYKLLIEPNEIEPIFSGLVTIRVHVNKKSHEILLNQRNLTIKAVCVEHIGGRSKAKITKVSVGGDLILVEFDDVLEKGAILNLGFDFTGIIRNDPTAFYMSFYKTHSGESRKVLATQMEANYARMVFPCYDEPSFKATFDISLRRRKNVTTISNSDLKETVKISEEILEDRYELTPKMSTYLVAFVYSDYKFIEVKSKSGVRIRAYASSDHMEKIEFFKDATPKILDFYESFFMIPYVMKKIDLVPIPDFGAAAMENWGLVTFAYNSYFVNNGTSSCSEKLWIATVLAHELSHQWFGNLVTMKWWGDLWLNEGFAAFMEVLGVDSIYPEWNITDSAFLSTMFRGFSADQLSTSHPVTLPIEDPDLVNILFDDISYSKGSSIVYMLYNVLGKKVFMKGINAYLNKFKFSNAETVDLWEALEKADGKLNVREMVDTWTLKKGFPLVTVSRKESSPVHYDVDQKQYTIEKISTNNTKDPRALWYVPLTWITNVEPTRKQIWLNKAKGSIKVTGVPRWIKVNYNAEGFYRVNYQKENWLALAHQLMENHHVFTARDRSALIQDAFTLTRSLDVSSDICLELIQYMEKETQYIVWSTALDALREWMQRMMGTLAYPLLKRHILHLLKGQAKILGWTDEGDFNQRRMREIIIQSAIKYEDPEQLSIAYHRFQKKESVEGTLTSAVYRSAAIVGDDQDWESLVEMFTHPSDPVNEERARNSLPFTKKVTLRKRLLDMTKNCTIVTSQQSIDVYAIMSSQEGAFDVVWQFLKSHWDYIQERNSGSGISFWLDSMIGILSRMNNKSQLDEMIEFFSKKKVPTRLIKESKEKINNNIKWLKHNHDVIYNWLKKNQTY